jgi:inner membrane protein
VMLGLMILGLVVPALFAMIDGEIGARRRAPRGRAAAALALLGIILMWGVRDFEHRRAVNALQARTYNGAEPLRVSAYPKIVDPFHWDGVVETATFFGLAPVDSLTPEVDPGGNLEIRYKPEETPATLAAKQSYIGRAFLAWAQYPVMETETLSAPQEGYVVYFQDVRYAGTMSLFGKRNRPLGQAVELDKNLHVVGDVYGVGEKRTVVPEPAQR